MKVRIIGGKSLCDVAELLRGRQELFLVYDENAAWVASAVSELVPVKGSFGLQTSEEQKQMGTVLQLCRRLLEADASRQAFLLTIGGGITSDLAGFAAGIYKRGIRYANLPTTLLAQVDAAVGGKTGVNLDGYKNMLGAFHMPEFTFLCPEVLRTLSPRELRSGLSEMLKTFLLRDATAYADTVRLFAASQTEGLEKLIIKAASIKAEIVEKDPFEKGERALLNLGHTFGHAIEHEARTQGDDITHGEAVAIGIVLAASLSEKLGIAQNGLAQQLEADFKRVGLPAHCPYPTEKLREAMAKDKKADGGRVKFVLLEAPGKPVLQYLNPFDIL